jgi:hypothetical protein
MNSELATASAHRDTTMTTDEENSEICLKLLGWKRVGTRYCIPGPNEIVWSIPSEMITRSGTPAFTTWAEAGLILDAFESKNVARCAFWQSHHNLHTGHRMTFQVGRGETLGAQGTTGPLATRAGALEYLRSLP